MEIGYIKANDVYYRPQEVGVQHPGKVPGCFYAVCNIKKLSFGRWQIDFHDDYLDFHKQQDNQIPASRVILYPSGIQEIKYK